MGTNKKVLSSLRKKLHAAGNMSFEKYSLGVRIPSGKEILEGITSGSSQGQKFYAMHVAQELYELTAKPASKKLTDIAYLASVESEADRLGIKHPVH